MKKSSEDLNVDPTKFFFLKHAIHALIIVAAWIVIFYSIPELKALGVSLFASSGIIAAVVGFASQQAFSKYINHPSLVLWYYYMWSATIKIK